MLLFLHLERIVRDGRILANTQERHCVYSLAVEHEKQYQLHLLRQPTHSDSVNRNGVSTIGAYRFGDDRFLRVGVGDPVHRYVVPSWRDVHADFGIHQFGNVFEKGSCQQAHLLVLFSFIFVFLKTNF